MDIDAELIQAINLLISGAMSTGNQNYLPAIVKAKTFVNIVTSRAEEEQKQNTISKEDDDGDTQHDDD